MILSFKPSQHAGRWRTQIISFFLLAVGLLVFQLPTDQEPLREATNVSDVTQALRPSEPLTFNQAFLRDATQWQPYDSHSVSYSAGSMPLWLRVELAPTSQSRVVMLPDYPMERGQAWLVAGADIVETEPQLRLGAFGRPIVSIPRSETPLTLYIQVQTSGAYRGDLTLWPRARLDAYEQQQYLIAGVFFGFVIAMLLHHLFMFMSSGNTSYGLYAGYLLMGGLAVLAWQGIGVRYWWPDNPWFESRSMLMFGALALCCALLFCRRLLELKTAYPALSRLFLFEAWACLALAAFSLVFPYYDMLRILVLVLSVVVVEILLAAFWYMRRTRILAARFYAGAWVVMLVGVVMLWLPQDADTVALRPLWQWFMAGMVIEALLLSLMMGQVYQREAEQASESLQRAMRLDRDREQAKQRMQKQLEYQVEERTLELEVALRELSDKNRELEEHTTLDALTGIRNRRYFDKKYIAEVRRSRRQRFCLSVVMIDIDHFKLVNDQYGHHVGDECLRQVAHMIRDRIKRPGDEVCRYGGEEFVVVMPDTDPNGAFKLIEDIRMAISARPIYIDNHALSVSISAGVSGAVCELDAQDQQLQILADRALYDAKQRGRNRIEMRLPTPEEDTANV